MLLATSLFLAIDHAALIEQNLSSQGHASLKSGIFDPNRPIGICAPTGSVSKGPHGSGSCALNFVLLLSQASLTQVQGSSSLVQLSVALVSGVTVPVTMSVQGVPAGAAILFAPTSAKPSFSSTMTIATSAATPLGQFNITILASGGGLEKSAILSLLVVPIVHDIAIVSALVQETATVGSIVSINATVANYGSVSEAFELRAYANTTLVADLSGLKLAPSAIYAGRLMWNTTGFSPGAYKVLVTIPPVQGELDLLENSREAGKMLLTATPGPQPSPSPAAPGTGQAFNYGRQLAIVAAIAEAATVFLVVFRRKVRVRPERQ
jgi:CARDB protein